VIGKTVSHYRILSSIGAGGMGVVYAGEDVRLGRPVALKFVPEELARDHSAVGRLVDEARTASGLNHPNICTIYDIGEYEGQPFIVMELLKGQTLRDRLAAGPLKTHEAVDLGIQVADALDAAHQRDIVHRDIKPANLFLVDRGQAKILDFGLAKLVPHAATATTAGLTRDQTAEGVTLGTVSYMSPEQVTGEHIDSRTDLFSLGVVLYEALTGHQPFTGKTSAVIFSAILTRAPVAPVVLNPSVPLRLQEVINNCLEKDRELRYQDAAGLRAELRRVKRDLESGRSGVFSVSGSATAAYGGSRDTSTSRPTIPERATSKGRIARVAIVAGAVALSAALAAGAFFWWPRAAHPDASASAAPTPFVSVGDVEAARIRSEARPKLDESRAVNPAAPIIGELSGRHATQGPTAAAPQAVAPPARPAAEPPAAPSLTSAPPAPAATVSPAPVSPSTPPPPSASAAAVAPAPIPPPPETPAPSVGERRDLAPAATSSAETDEAAIRRVVAAYARAIETKDLALFRTVKPNLSGDEQRRIEDGFRAVSSQRVVVTIVSIEMRAQDAFVRLKRRDTLQAGGREQTTDSVQTMTFARTGSGWVIQEIGR
jgi:hypothetical protein